MIKLIFDLLVSEDSNSVNPKNSDRLYDSLSDDYTEFSRNKIVVSDATTDLTINLSDPNSEYLVISCDQTITIKLNGSSDSITLTPKTAGSKNVVLFMKGAITALTVSNASGSSCNLDVITLNV